MLYTCRAITELKHAGKELTASRLELAHAGRLALAGELTALSGDLPTLRTSA